MNRKIRTLYLAFFLLIVSSACQPLQPVPVSSATSLPTLITAVPATLLPPTVRPVVCTDHACLDVCLARIKKVLPKSVIDPIGGDYADTELDLNLLYYDVKNGQLGEPKILYAPSEFKRIQQDVAAQQRAWKYASAMLPPDQLKWIVTYEIFSSSYYAARVSPIEHDRSKWTLALDLEDAQNPLSLTIVLTHEFGHLITLNSDQIPQSNYYFSWKQNQDSCAQFLSPDGCSTPNSYINLFYQAFWKDIFEKWYEVVVVPHVNSSEEGRRLIHDFYQLYPKQFVREYAATNIYEDMAESFQHFILDPEPTGKSVVDQKILFFYDFPELLTLRQQMIQNICSYAQ